MATRYAEIADLSNTIRTQALVGIADATKNAELDAASQLADGYLRSRMTLPLSVWGADLRKNVCVIAAFNLMVGRGFSPTDGSNEALRMRYEDALAWLKDVSRGLVQLTAPTYVDASAPESTDAGGVATGGEVVQPRVDDCGVLVVSSPRLRGW